MLYIWSEVGSANINIMCVCWQDVADEGSVMVAALKLGAKHAPGSIYGLVNNAGVGFGRNTAEVVGVNYFGPKNVTTAMLPLLNPQTGRVVNISSAAGPMVRFKFIFD